MAQLIPVRPFDLIIFGGNGDLATRKLLPALFHRYSDGQFSDDSRIIGVGRSPMAQDAYLKLGFQEISGYNYPLTGPKSLKIQALMPSFFNGRFKPGNAYYLSAPGC